MTTTTAPRSPALLEAAAAVALQVALARWLARTTERASASESPALLVPQQRRP